jgi:gas vesicle protein
VTDRSSILLCALAGAVVGGAAGYFLMTEDGRRLRADLEPKLMDLMSEFEKARALLDPGATTRGDVRNFSR